MRTRILTFAAGLTVPLFAVACSSSPSGAPAPTGDAGPETGVEAGGSTGRDAGGPVGTGDGDGGGGQGSDAAGAHDGPLEGSSEGGPEPDGLSYMVGIKTNGVSRPARRPSRAGSDVRSTSRGRPSRRRATSARAPPTRTASGGHPLLEVSFPLLSIFGENNGLTDLAQAASGAYDATYEAMAAGARGVAQPAPLGAHRLGVQRQLVRVVERRRHERDVRELRLGLPARREGHQASTTRTRSSSGASRGVSPIPTPYWPGAYDASTNPGGVDVVSIGFLPGQHFPVR